MKKDTTPATKADNSVPRFVPNVLLYVSAEGWEGGERGGGERENAELSVFEWAHYSAQREALYSAQPAYHTIEVTKQL